MNWSAYSRLVGNVFVARWPWKASSPSSWNRPSSDLDLRLEPVVQEGAPGHHLARRGGTMLSAAFIMAANS